MEDFSFLFSIFAQAGSFLPKILSIFAMLQIFVLIDETNPSFTLAQIFPYFSDIHTRIFLKDLIKIRDIGIA